MLDCIARLFLAGKGKPLETLCSHSQIVSSHCQREEFKLFVEDLVGAGAGSEIARSIADVRAEVLLFAELTGCRFRSRILLSE